MSNFINQHIANNKRLYSLRSSVFEKPGNENTYNYDNLFLHDYQRHQYLGSLLQKPNGNNSNFD